MRVAAIVGAIRRHGTIVLWEHAIPASGDDVDPASRGPKLSIGGRREIIGPSGERYGRPYSVRAYVSHRISQMLMQAYGAVDGRDAQLDLVVPFAAEPQNGIVEPDAHTLEAFNAGRFAQFKKNAPTAESLELAARDRFTVGGIPYVVKAAAVPLQDGNRTVVWRLLIGATTF